MMIAQTATKSEAVRYTVGLYACSYFSFGETNRLLVDLSYRSAMHILKTVEAKLLQIFYLSSATER